MSKMTINGCDLEFNIFEAKSAGLFQRANEKLIEDVGKLKKIENKSFEELIYTQCGIIFEFVDTLFGEDTHKKIFGEKCDLKLCSDVYLAILKEIAKQRESLPVFAGGFPKPNRKARRAQGKAETK